MNMYLSVGLFILGYFMVGFGLATIAARMGRLGNTPEEIKEDFALMMSSWPIAIIFEIYRLAKAGCDKWIDYLFRPRN
jgi:hypothetical protein